MKILVLADHKLQEEFRKKFTTSHEYIFKEDYDFDPALLESTDLVFDFFIDESPENFDLYKDIEGLTVFCNCPKLSLAELVYFHGTISCTLLGFNGLPTMLDRQYLEVSLLYPQDETKLQEICKALGTEFLIVEDRIGMVTPRVLAMLINEAYYTLQEGITSREDLDKGMRLGTNYPTGPFEMCDKIGLKHIYELLEALYEDTKDDRYKICPALKRAYLLS